MKTKHAYGIAPGTSGEQETECQARVKIVNENGISAIFLADPAEAAMNAGSYAELGTKAAAAVLAERFDELYPLEEEPVRQAIQEKIEEAFRGAKIKSFGTGGSLLFAAVKENRYLAGHSGGGLIARLNGSCSVLSGPGAEGSEMNMRIYKGDLQEPFGFMLISNGACKSLYEYDTGNLSSVCGTFFEWLKEYDEETVSEALADNIKKYFFKNTSDISVAVMVSDDEAAASVPAAEGGKGRKYLKIAIAAALIIILAAVFVFTLKQPGAAGQTAAAKSDPKPAVTNLADYEPLVTFSVKNPKSYDAGTYQVGEDIPAGEYFFWAGGMLKPDSIKVNDFTCLSGELYCLTVRVNEGDTLTSDVRFTAAENVNPVKAANGILISGKYKIGKDILPGEYEILPADRSTEGRYYFISGDEIKDNTKFSGETTVEVPEEGYLVFYNSMLKVSR